MSMLAPLNLRSGLYTNQDMYCGYLAGGCIPLLFYEVNRHISTFSYSRTDVYNKTEIQNNYYTQSDILIFQGSVNASVKVQF